MPLPLAVLLSLSPPLTLSPFFKAQTPSPATQKATNPLHASMAWPAASFLHQDW
eukprot:CAMPEP_0171406516 /NCGR_PEP_ID=MMETSP0880-20121228/17915_1 /TAXON_ID=67004 /ORGANISM="Thalassiosira weissflogii, Strain CCMP1336" /LENGTH=53 /DNA_ID=CAMNT_0011922225 /DNA_START=14 /DNA_END=172 /DNA_ORIENTATION=+